jgi:hypothetical protein
VLTQVLGEEAPTGAVLTGPHLVYANTTNGYVTVRFDPQERRLSCVVYPLDKNGVERLGQAIVRLCLPSALAVRVRATLSRESWHIAMRRG